MKLQISINMLTYYMFLEDFLMPMTINKATALLLTCLPITWKVSWCITLYDNYYLEGFWLLHSHLGHHQSQGMALVLQEGDTEDMVHTPPNFPTCGSFQTSKEQIEKAISVYKKILIAREAGSSFGKYTCLRQLSLELLNHFIDILA